MYFIGKEPDQYRRYNSIVDALYNLPFDSRVTVIKGEDSYTVKIFCPIWVEKEVTLPTTYGLSFTPEMILRDCAAKVLSKFGYTGYYAPNKFSQRII